MDLPTIGCSVVCEVIKEGFEQVTCKILNKQNILFIGIIKGSRLKYKKGDKVECKVISYSDNGIILSTIKDI